MSEISREEVADFFDRCRAAFDRLDGNAVADLWHVPCAIQLMRGERGLCVLLCIAHDEDLSAMQGAAH